MKDLARDFVVEAVSPDDGIVEAFRWSGPSYVAAVQWHPERLGGRADAAALFATFVQITSPD